MLEFRRRTPSFKAYQVPDGDEDLSSEVMKELYHRGSDLFTSKLHKRIISLPDGGFLNIEPTDWIMFTDMRLTVVTDSKFQNMFVSAD